MRTETKIRKRADAAGRCRAGRTVYSGILQLLYPLRCPVCDRIVRPAGERICLECLGRLKIMVYEMRQKAAGRGRVLR